MDPPDPVPQFCRLLHPPTRTRSPNYVCIPWFLNLRLLETELNKQRCHRPSCPGWSPFSLPAFLLLWALPDVAVCLACPNAPPRSWHYSSPGARSGGSGVQNAGFPTPESHLLPNQVMLTGSRNEDLGVFLYRPLFEPLKHTDKYHKHHKCQEMSTQGLLENNDNLWIPSTRYKLFGLLVQTTYLALTT